MDHDGERCRELARHGREVADQLVGVLADDAAGREVGENAARQIGRAQQIESGLALDLVHGMRSRLPRRRRLADRGVLQLLELAQNAAEIGLEHRFGNLQLYRRLSDEAGARPGVVEVERIDVERPHRTPQAD